MSGLHRHAQKKKTDRAAQLGLGECLRAPPPPPRAADPLPQPEVDGLELEDDLGGMPQQLAQEKGGGDTPPVAAKMTRQHQGASTVFQEHPHACLAFSDVATWGSATQGFSDEDTTDAPGIELDDMQSLSEDGSEFDSDDDWIVLK